jgi:formate dehydrogenase major subunit
MNGEGVGRLFSNGVNDGPFPEHYEPVESPVKNPLHPAHSEDPVAFLYTGGSGAHGAVKSTFGSAENFPYVATTYRLTEHEHYVTQHVPLLAGLQPKPFVEIPEELAAKKGISSGDRVRVRSNRGKVEVLALVTKRLAPYTVDGKKVFTIGVPIHWGFVGVAAESDPSKGANWIANALTPFVGDANAFTPEFKAFLVDLEKL